MKTNCNTFLEYLQNDVFYNKIYRSVLSFCRSHKDFVIDKSREDISYIRDIDDDDIELEYKQVWIENKKYPIIEFDIAVDVTCSFSGVYGRHRDIDRFSASFWVLVSCTGSMVDKLTTFKITSVEDYTRYHRSRPLNGDLVPIISKDKYDEYATELLSMYYPEALKSPIKIDVDLLANRMGLTVLNHSISLTKTVFGQIFFSDSNAAIYVNNEEKSIHVKKNTIIVDDEASYLRSYGSRNMTVAHECLHSYLHRPAFEFAKMINNDIHFIQCQVEGVFSGEKNKSITEWMEIQANGLAPCVLMPAEMVRQYLKSIIPFYKSAHGGTVLSWINDVVQAVADEFEVTIYAARKRLIDLGYNFAIGAFNWIDGAYVRPYSFKKGFLNSNETFTVNPLDIYDKTINTPAVLPYIMEGSLQFVENHLCVNSDKYIEKDSSGKSILTDYALCNMDECFVKFNYKSIKGFSSGHEFGLMCYLCRDCTKEIEFDLEVNKNLPAILNDPTLKVRYKTHIANVDEVCKTISTMSFGDIVGYLLEYLDITLQEFAYDTGLNERTIRRYIKGENKVPDKRSVVAIIRALNVPYKISNLLIIQAGIAFRMGNAEDDILLFVMQNCREQEIDEVNKFMVEAGFNPLTTAA